MSDVIKDKVRTVCRFVSMLDEAHEKWASPELKKECEAEAYKQCQGNVIGGISDVYIVYQELLIEKYEDFLVREMHQSITKGE